MDYVDDDGVSHLYYGSSIIIHDLVGGEDVEKYIHQLNCKYCNRESNFFDRLYCSQVQSIRKTCDVFTENENGF